LTLQGAAVLVVLLSGGADQAEEGDGGWSRWGVFTEFRFSSAQSAPPHRSGQWSRL